MYPQWWNIRPSITGWYVVLKSKGLILSRREQQCVMAYIHTAAPATNILGQRDRDEQAYAWFGPITAGIPLDALPGTDMINVGGDATFSAYYIPPIPT